MSEEKETESPLCDLACRFPIETGFVVSLLGTLAALFIYFRYLQ